MGMVKSESTGVVVRLVARTLVGRAADCALVLSDPLASGEHASVWWTGEQWKLRDLGSRNGTFVDGHRVGPGHTVLLTRGSRVAFGNRDNVFEVVDDNAPSAMGKSDGGIEEFAVGGILSLPSGEDPEVQIFRDVTGYWVAERDGGSQVIVDRGQVQAGGSNWTLSLPVEVDATVESSMESLRHPAMSIHFKVSRDEEFVEVTITHDSAKVLLEPRSYHYALLTLARHRLQDKGLPIAEQGWIHLDSLARMLRVDRRTLNVHICRVRQQLAGQGIDGAAGIIERRQGTGQLRIGVHELEVASL